MLKEKTILCKVPLSKLNCHARGGEKSEKNSPWPSFSHCGKEILREKERERGEVKQQERKKFSNLLHFASVVTL